MTADTTFVAGFAIPSSNPIFLGILAVHILAGFSCVVTAAFAIFSVKGSGRHIRFGTWYFRALIVVVTTTTALAAMRWREDYHLFFIGSGAILAAYLARRSVRGASAWRTRAHIAGMGLSCVLLLVGFYVDNGRQLPIWKHLPRFLYWLVPIAIGGPLTLWAMLRHRLSLAEQEKARG